MQATYPGYSPVVRDPTDVIGRRIAAFIIDWGIAFVMFIVLAVSLAETEDYFSASRAEFACDQINEVANDLCVPVDGTTYVYDDGDLAILLLLPLAYQFLNDGLLAGVTGFSLGKGIVGLRVIRQSDGQLAGVGRCLLRWLLWLADAQPCGLPVVGLVTGLASKGHRRVGDMAAGTFVVDKRDVGVVPVVPGLTNIVPAWGAAPGWGPGTPPPTWGAPPAWGPPQSPPPPSSPGWGAPPPAQPPTGPPWTPPAQSWQPPPAQSWEPQPPAWDAPPPAQSWQPQPPAWDAPPPPAQPPQAQQPASPAPGVDGPIWDDARDTYIQWDPDVGAWVQWDDVAKEWRPIV